MAKREHQVGELALFQQRNQLLEVLVEELAGVFFKDGLRGLGRWRVEQHDHRHVLAERLRDAGKSCWVGTHTLMLAWREKCRA